MIEPDNDQTQANDDSSELVTILIKFYKNPTTKTIWVTKTTKNMTLIKPMDLGYKRYPIACFGWEEMKNSYWYISPMSAVIENQIAINKMYSMFQLGSQQALLPKVMYDKNKIQIEKFLNDSKPYAVAGIDFAGKFLDFIKTPDLSMQYMNYIDNLIQQTKETLGATDTALGEVSPDNTSAIIALQEASATPLEIQRSAHHEFWEDIVRNIIDIMSISYGVREVLYEDEIAIVDFSVLQDLNYELNIDVGAGAQYSEIAQINTADKLLQSGGIKLSTYLKNIPDKYILGKAEYLKDAEATEQMQVPQM